MATTMKVIIFIFLALLISGCSNEYKKEIMKEELRKDINISEYKANKKPALQIVEVSAENFKVNKLVLPQKEQVKRVKILGAQLNDVIALLTEATNQNIIFQLQSDALSDYSDSRYNINGTNNTNNINNNNYNNNNSYENNDEYQIRESKVYVSASNIGFGRLLKKAVGDKLSIRHEDDTYYLGYVKTVTLKIPSLSGLSDQLKKTLTTLGAVNVVHDSITSSVTFSAREKEYVDIMKYLTVLRNNLYVIEYNISIYDVELKDDYNLGINWSLMPTGEKDLGFTSKVASSFGKVGASATSATFGALLNAKDYSGSIMAEALSNFGKVESIQKPKLLGIAGTDVVLIDGMSEPYIKELSTTAVGDSGVQTSTVSAQALSGLKVTLNSNIMDGTVITDISIEINDIVGYNSFTVKDVTYSQPRVHTKNIKNNIRVKPGVPIVISGLFRHDSDKGYKGIPGVAQTQARLLGGSEYKSKTKSEMVIIVTPRVIKYVMK